MLTRANKVAIIVLFLALVFFFYLSGCSQESSAIRQVTVEKAKVTEVETFNKQPNQDSNEDDRFLAEQILGSKGNKTVRYKIKASGYVDKKKYLQKHPEDGLTISSSNSDGRSDVRVYSDNPIPDPEFFQ